jgi:hypothetical protein
MAEEEILRRLDLIQATLQLAFAAPLAEAREAIRSDKVNAAILDLAEDWVPSTALQDQASKKAGVNARAVRDRFPGLVAQRVLEARGSERKMEYRRTGIV